MGILFIHWKNESNILTTVWQVPEFNTETIRAREIIPKVILLFWATFINLLGIS